MKPFGESGEDERRGLISWNGPGFCLANPEGCYSGRRPEQDWMVMDFVSRLVVVALISGVGLSSAFAQDRCMGQKNAVVTEYRNTVHGFVRRRIRSLNYASVATYVMVLTLSVSKDGRIVSSEIVRQSGAPVFDSLVLRAFPVGLQTPPIPTCTGMDRMTFTFPLRNRAPR